MNRRDARIFYVALALAGVFTMAAVPQSANLTGTWRLDKKKSFFGSDHPTTAYQLTKTITENGDDVMVTDASVHQVIMGFHLPDSTATTTLVLNGEEREGKGTPLFPGMPQPTVTLASEWQGGTLYTTQRSNGYGGLSISHTRYFLSSDSAELVELINSHSTFGDVQQRLVFDRQK